MLMTQLQHVMNRMDSIAEAETNAKRIAANRLDRVDIVQSGLLQRRVKLNRQLASATQAQGAANAAMNSKMLSAEAAATAGRARAYSDQ
jgi:hypothetical protein